jgi:hypothetical protein
MRIFYLFLKYFIKHYFICRPPYFPVLEDTRIELRTVARFWHTLYVVKHLTTQLDLIQVPRKYMAVFTDKILHFSLLFTAGSSKSIILFLIGSC